MKRWHLTFGLTSLALGAAFLAPRLIGRSWNEEVVPPPVPTVVPDVVAEALPTPEVPSLPTGHLVVDAGLDRAAVLRGDESERYLTVTVTAPLEAGKTVRRPVDLAVVMDTSDRCRPAARSTRHGAQRSSSRPRWSPATPTR
jgi:hypothetical protein